MITAASVLSCSRNGSIIVYAGRPKNSAHSPPVGCRDLVGENTDRLTSLERGKQRRRTLRIRGHKPHVVATTPRFGEQPDDPLLARRQMAWPANSAPEPLRCQFWPRLDACSACRSVSSAS